MFKFVTLTALFTVLIPQDVSAFGTEIGNGGQAWVCRNFVSEVISAKLRDFHEFKNFEFMKFYNESVHNPKTLNDWLYEVAQKSPQLKKSIWYAKQDYLQSLAVNQDSVFVRPFKSAYDSGDADEVFHPKGTAADDLMEVEDSRPGQCRYEYFAYRAYDSARARYTFNFKTEILKKMSNFDLAGALIHEAGWSNFSTPVTEHPDLRPAKKIEDSKPLRQHVRKLFYLAR